MLVNYCHLLRELFKRVKLLVRKYGYELGVKLFGKKCMDYVFGPQLQASNHDPHQDTLTDYEGFPEGLIEPAELRKFGNLQRGLPEINKTGIDLNRITEEMSENEEPEDSELDDWLRKAKNLIDNETLYLQRMVEVD